MATRKEAKDLKPGDIQIRSPGSRWLVTRVVPLAGSVEVDSHQVGKPDNRSIAELPGHMMVEVEE